MKHIYPYIVLSIAILINVFTANCQLLVDNHIVYKNNEWYNTTYNYDSNNNITEINTKISSDKNNWIKHSYSSLKYNNNNLCERFNYIWINSSWKFDNSIKISYNKQNKIEDKTTEEIINGSNYKEITHYEYKIGSIKTITKQYVDNLLKNSIESVKEFRLNKTDKITIKNYDKNNNLLLTEIIEFFYSGNFLSEIKSTNIDNNNISNINYTKYFYNTLNKLSTEIQYSKKQGGIYPVAKNEYFYNGEEIEKINYSIWNERFWTNILIKRFEYNDFKMLSNSYYSKPKFKMWKDYCSSSYIYDESNNVIKEGHIEKLFWADQSHDINDFIKIDNNLPFKYIYGKDVFLNYSFNTPTDITNTPNPITIYPNPSNTGLFYIQSELNILKIEIYDIQGRLLHKSEDLYDVIDLQFLHNGVYIAQVYTQENYYSTKIVINR